MKIIDFIKKFGFSILSLGLPLLTFAQAHPGPATAQGSNPTPTAEISKVQGVLDFVCNIFGWMFYFLIALAVLFIVIGAYRYLTSGGNPEKVKGANNTLLYAAIAVAVGLLARSIPLIVADFLGTQGTANLWTC